MKIQSFLIASVVGLTFLTACEQADESTKDVAATAPQPAVEAGTTDSTAVVETQVTTAVEGTATGTELSVEETTVQVIDQVAPEQPQAGTEKANEVIGDATTKADETAAELQDATKEEVTKAEDSANKAVEDAKSEAASLTDSATETVENAETTINKETDATKTEVQGTLDALGK